MKSYNLNQKWANQGGACFKCCKQIGSMGDAHPGISEYTLDGGKTWSIGVVVLLCADCSRSAPEQEDRKRCPCCGRFGAACRDEENEDENLTSEHGFAVQ